MSFESFKFDSTWTDEEKKQVQDYYEDIFTKQEYNQYGISVQKNDVVVDCGANVGVFTKFALEKGAKKVIAFEAVEKNYECFKNNFSNKKNVIPVHALVNHSAVDVVADGFTKKQYDLAKIYKEFNLKKINFLKLDVESCEFGLLLNCSDEDILKVDKLVVEMHVCGWLKEKADEYHFVLKIIERLNCLNYVTFVKYNHETNVLITLYAVKKSVLGL
jgi:hypothetical protein